jgi:hypothetical protein
VLRLIPCSPPICIVADPPDDDKEVQTLVHGSPKSLEQWSKQEVFDWLTQLKVDAELSFNVATVACRGQVITPNIPNNPKNPKNPKINKTIAGVLAHNAR